MHFSTTLVFTISLLVNSLVLADSTETIPLIRVRESSTGGSEFIDETISLGIYSALGNLSSPYTKGPLQFRVTGDSYGTGANAVPHNAPFRQFAVTLTGAINITVINKFENGTTQRGETRMIKAGELVFAEDVNGTGHYSLNSYPGERYSFFYPVADDELVYTGHS